MRKTRSWINSRAHAKPGAINLIKGRAVCVLKQNGWDSGECNPGACRHGRSDDTVTYIIWIPFAFKCRAKPKRKKEKKERKDSRVNCPCREHGIARGSGRDYGKNNAPLKLVPARCADILDESDPSFIAIWSDTAYSNVYFAAPPQTLLNLRKCLLIHFKRTSNYVTRRL